MSDPTRFRDAGSEAPAELRQLFEAGASDLPTDAELQRLAAALGPVLDAPPAGGPPSRWPTLAKVAALGVAVAGVSVLFAVNLGPHGQRPPRAPEVTPAPPVLSSAPENAATSVPASSAPGPSSSSGPSETASARPNATNMRPAETEAELLERARGALAGNPARALALTDQHRVRFPAGVLVQEREVIAIQALKRLGRTDEAARRANDFARRYPTSAYRKKLDSSPP